MDNLSYALNEIKIAFIQNKKLRKVLDLSFN